MDALGAAQQWTLDRDLEPRDHLVGPRARREDHDPRRHAAGLAGQPVAHRHAGDPAVGPALEPRHLGVGVAIGPQRAGVDRILEHQARVVGVAVVVFERAAQAIGAQRGLELERGPRAAEGLVEPRRAEQRQRVVDP